MLTFAGIGIFHCGCTQSQGLVVMAVQTTCPACTTSAKDCCPHNDHHHDEESDGCHDDDCCSLKYQYLTVDQLSATQCHDIQPKVLSLFFSSFLSVDGFTAGVRECFTIVKNHSPPPDLLKIPLIYIHDQLRL